ncbi:MAG: M48 family metalloprotease [Bacteroidota bacterium]
MKHLIFFLLVTSWVNTNLAQSEFEKERKKGEAVALEVEQQMGLVHVQAAEEMVKKIGNRLVAQIASNPYQFSFQIVDQADPNAFALPGGFVYVSRGLLMLLKNEDELAGVIGHEISHVMKQHSSNRQRKSVLPGILAVPAVVFGNTLGQGMGEKIAAPVLGASKAYLASYSRKQELEADELGIALAAKAGYQPLLLADILNRLEKFVKAETGQASRYSIFDDHPMTPDRMKAIREKAISLSVATAAPVAPSTFEFLSSFNQVMFGADPSQGIFNENVFLHPGLKMVWELPKDWTYFNEATMAGAVSPDQKTLVALKVAGRDRQIDTLIVKFVNNYYATTRKKPMLDTTLILPGRKGSEVVMPAKKKNEILFSVWFIKDGLTYAIVGSGTVDRLKEFEKISQTFRDLAATDYPLIQFRELLTVKSQSGESVVTLSKRTQNSAGPNMTLILNEISEGYNFKKDEPVKVILLKPYQMR